MSERPSICGYLSSESVVISSANDSDSDGIKTEDFVLVGGHLDVYNALSEMTDDSVNVFDFKEYKFD